MTDTATAVVSKVYWFGLDPGLTEDSTLVIASEVDGKLTIETVNTTSPGEPTTMEDVARNTAAWVAAIGIPDIAGALGVDKTGVGMPVYEWLARHVAGRPDATLVAGFNAVEAEWTQLEPDDAEQASIDEWNTAAELMALEAELARDAFALAVTDVAVRAMFLARRRRRRNV